MSLDHWKQQKKPNMLPSTDTQFVHQFDNTIHTWFYHFIYNSCLVPSSMKVKYLKLVLSKQKTCMQFVVMTSSIHLVNIHHSVTTSTPHILLQLVIWSAQNRHLCNLWNYKLGLAVRKMMKMWDLRFSLRWLCGLPSSGMWCHLVWYKFLEEHAASITRAKEKSLLMFLWNTDELLPNHRVSDPTRE